MPLHDANALSDLRPGVQDEDEPQQPHSDRARRRQRQVRLPGL